MARHTDEPTTPHEKRAGHELFVVTLPGDEQGEGAERYGTFVLSTGGRNKLAIGAVALRMGNEMLKPMRKGLAEAIARNLVGDDAAD